MATRGVDRGAVAGKIAENPELVKTAPHRMLVGRIDETRAARQPDLRWRPRD